MKKPKIIFKYEEFSAQSLQNLKAQSIFFGSPLRFNDTYDCALNPSLKNPTEKQLEVIRHHYTDIEDVPPQVKVEFKNASKSKLKLLIERVTLQALRMHNESLVRKIGVSCFSEKNDDLLMWAHYGGKYKGFCLEFATSYEPFKLMRKVKYTTVMPKLNPASVILNNDFEQVLDLYFTKSKSWDYEKEWRVIHAEANTMYTYESEALKAIYFGPDIDMQSLEIICLVISGQNPGVKFWRGKRSTERFKVDFEPFKYINHIEAKRRSLNT